MRPAPARKPCRLAVLTALLVAAGAWAGDPVPDVDVILEQIPGGVAKARSMSGGFNEAYLEVGKDFAKAMNPTALPAGWAVQVDGKTVRLTGPAVSGPVQFKFDIGSAPRPAKITYGAKLDGRTLVEHKNVPTKLVPPQTVISDVRNLLQLPATVAPGEAMQMKVLDPSALPAGGTWSLSGSLSGSVVAEEEREDPEDMKPSEPKRRVALTVPPGQSVPDEALADIVTVLAAREVPEGPWEVVAFDEKAPLENTTEVWAVGRNPQSPSTPSTVARMQHDMAKSTIQNMKAVAAPAPGGGGVVAYSVRPTGALEGSAGPWVVVTGLAVGEEDIPVDDKKRRPAIPPEQKAVKVTAETQPGGGRVHSFELSGGPPAAEFLGGIGKMISSAVNSPPKAVKAPINRDGTVTFDQLPDDLQPGGAVAVQFVDDFGDVLVDVPSVPGVEVVEPRGGGEARITGASPRGLAGQLACVCGSFPGPAAWNALLLDGQAVGSPTSASGQMAWVQLAAGLPPGEHVFTGAAAGGFPATDRATTLVLQVGGELDSSKLRQLQTTPMRLWIVGTEEPLDLRVRNLTPGIISIDGGVDQTIRTSGGARNMLERTVRGLAPGAFNINYELGGESCPCGQTHYY